MPHLVPAILTYCPLRNGTFIDTDAQSLTLPRCSGRLRHTLHTGVCKVCAVIVNMPCASLVAPALIVAKEVESLAAQLSDQRAV